VWGNRTTVYVNALYEKDVSGNLSTKYYYLGGQRIAMRRGSTLTYLHGDHLGSASLATDASGTKITDSDTRYSPYGVTRPGLAGTGLPTDRRFTGQREEASLGCYDYVARPYAPALGRFLQADTLVPDPGNPQSLNRYSYVLGNPLRYTDPTGHLTDEEIAQALGFDSVDELYASKLWMMWTSRAFGDSYWIAVLRALQAGDRLYATERLGHLSFQTVDGVMRLFGQEGAASANLWDWQGAGFYTIGRYASERENARLSDAVFSSAASFHPVYLGFGDLDQPLYSYGVGPRGGITVEYLGYRIIGRSPGINPASTTGLLTGGHSAWKWMADIGLTFASYITPGYVYIKTSKLLVDLGLTVHKSIADPVFHYDLEFGLPTR